MLVGYVSDERYMAVADALVELEQDGRSPCVVRSSPRGAIHGDVRPGACRVTLAKDGFGSKSVTISIDPARPHQFRLLADRLLGYMWPKWCRAGDRAEFRVHSVEPCRLTLWRYGWQKEFVRMLGWHDEHGPRAAMQITPDGDYTPTGVQWNRQGYGNPHQSQLVPAPERSGLYYVHAEGEWSGAFFSFPWIVAPRRPQARIAVLASNFTWNAYNSFGGRSNYINADRLPERPTVNARLDLARYTESGAFNVWGPPDSAYTPLSFERPEIGNHVPAEMQVTDPIRGRLACGMAPAEWRLLGWLEREGYAYDYYAETQLDDGLVDLDAYRVLVLSVHPEYWTRRMYTDVKAWVEERGGRLMYLGGNGLNCEVERLDAATMRCRTQLLSVGGELGMRDPADPRIYLESRMHRTLESEANLLGVVTSHTGIMTGAPYRVRDAAHWGFAGTDLRDGDVFGAASLQERVSGGASGHETDKMSASSPPGTQLLAKGLNPDDGGAEIVYRETPSGGAVFSVGSITFVASLLVDPAVSRLTTNVLGRLLANGGDRPRPPAT